MLEKLLSWVSVTDGHDLLDKKITLEQHRELWVKARDSMRTSLATLRNEPARQLHYHSTPPASTGPQYVIMK